ncbi:MAG TPA: acyl-CoA thioesterase, partial [Flavisolibacter sp.]|nr:acyl-CoA thioesterase [Flavisolibacter sp.]
MEVFKMNVQLRWSDLDPNYHVRHSAYYDWGALCRIQFLNDYGLSSDVMAKLQFGPILFREECIFRKEIKLGDDVSINLS